MMSWPHHYLCCRHLWQRPFEPKTVQSVALGSKVETTTTTKMTAVVVVVAAAAAAEAVKIYVAFHVLTYDDSSHLLWFVLFLLMCALKSSLIVYLSLSLSL